MSPKPKGDEDKLSRRKLVDRLLPAPQYGPLVGLLATTYEFKPEFFETDFLPTLLGLGAWDDRNWTSRVAVEKALSELEGAAVFADARRYQGRPRSLRVDVTPVALPAGAALHAKVVLLVHRDAVRLHVASANLTDYGYRRNREVAAPLIATSTRPEHAALISAALEGMRGALGPWWTETAEHVVGTALGILAQWPTARDDEDHFLWGTAATSPWERFLDAWPNSDAVHRVTIVSPFWAEERNDDGPLAQLVARLRVRGVLVPDAAVRLLTDAKNLGGEKYQPVLPESFATFDGRRLKIVATAEAVDPRVLPEEVDNQEGVLVPRPLHAKVILLEGTTTSMAYMGSANFSNRAWGLPGVPQNVEAGLVLRREGKARAALTTLIPRTVGTPVPLAGAAKGHLALPVEDDPKKPWPVFLRELCLTPDAGRSERLLLQVRVDPAEVGGAWSVALVDQTESTEGTLLVAATPTDPEYRIDLSPAWLEQLLRDQEVRVRWWTPDGDRNVPINVAPSARDALPVVPGSAKPGESLLLAYYQGRITFEELFPDPDGVVAGEAAGAIAESSSVDTARIQSYQVREFVEALKGIRDDLKQAAKSTPRAMRLALRGAVSPVALARAVAVEVEADRRSPTAGAFQFFEILCCLLEARTFSVDPQHAAAWEAETKQATEIIQALLDILRASYPDALGGSFSRYERQLRAHYRGSTEAP
jgi:hypothetical protein